MKKNITLIILFFSAYLYAEDMEKYTVPNEWDAMHFYGEASKGSINKKKIGFLVWNIHKEVDESQWKKDYAYLSKGKDIILLQEFTTNSSVSDFPAGFEKGQSVFGESFEKKGRKAGNLNFSDYKSKRSEVFHSFDREPVINTPKPIVKTTYRMEDGKDLVVFNVHGINFKNLDPFKRYIQVILMQLRGHQERVIVAGDFNTWSKRRLKFMHESFNKIGLEPIKFKNSHLIKTWRGNKLDHSFQRGFKTVSAYIPEGIKSSDHAPMVFTLEY